MAKKKITKQYTIHHHFRLALLIVAPSLLIYGLFYMAQVMNAEGVCRFETTKSVMKLEEDCTTDTSVIVPDGHTLDGQGHMITAIDDQEKGNFTGGIIENGGAVAHVKNLTVTTSGLVDACMAGGDRLRGILFDGASGSITHNTIIDVHKGQSGCQEGHGIEVRNAPNDGTLQSTIEVEIAHNTVSNYQKTGILAYGDVSFNIHDNSVGYSATQDTLAANSIQVGFGATGSINRNTLYGNQWMGGAKFGGSSILVYDAKSVDVRQNTIQGSSDIGIYYFANGGILADNKVFDSGTDGPYGDYGIVNNGLENVINDNTIKGFATEIRSSAGRKNSLLPSYQKF